MSASGDEFIVSYHETPEEADELLALSKVARARKAGRTFAPSPLARPLPGSVGRPVREPDAEGRAA
jgi:hypothetical protein